ncbi:MAG: hypothetical protein FWG64_14950 [Firmicutes bacterium]|nr:hypothetical protein [Bacillota bacterium]
MQNKKFVPIEKQSKKCQKEHYKAARNSWDINPITRKKPNSKLYNRKKSKTWHKTEPFWIFLFYYNAKQRLKNCSCREKRADIIRPYN